MLTEEQIRRYERDGVIMLPDCLGESELDVLRRELPSVFSEDLPNRVLEAESGAVRGVHGVHESNPVFARLVRLPRLVRSARQLLGSDVYVHQFKINPKVALVGEIWEWHQDFRFWRDEDGMPEPRALSAAIFLDAVDEFNGPLMFVPGSHHDGVYKTSERNDVPWEAGFSAKLKYSIEAETLAAATRNRGIIAPKGPAGSILLFHGNTVHGSAPNMSPNNRTMIIISYNSVKNCPTIVPNPRPEFVASRNFTPIDPLDDDTLISMGTGRSEHHRDR